MPGLSETTDLLRVLADPTRLRLLALLAHGELTVAEIVRVTDLAQSRVSTHLGTLREASVVRDRRAGASSFYALDTNAWTEDTRRLLTLVQSTAADPLIEQDTARLAEVLEARQSGATWADSVAGSMERYYSPGRTWEATLRGMLGLVRLGDVLDVASGDGAIAELIAPRARSITCLDGSETVIEAARKRLSPMGNVRFVHGDMHAMPVADASFDQVMILNCLTHARAPKRVLAEAARALRPGGDLAGVTLKTHKHGEAAAAFDHVRLGFAPAELRSSLEALGFDVELCEVTSREKRPPHFEVITIHAKKREAPKRKKKAST